MGIKKKHPQGVEQFADSTNTQLYAQAGNSIVVNCLVAIFGQMFEGKERIYEEQNRTDA